MKTIYILLTSLLFLSINITANEKSNKKFNNLLAEANSKIQYLTYKISKQEEDISYLSNRVINLHEMVYTLVENKDNYMSKNDVIVLLKRAIKAKEIPISLNLTNEENSSKAISLNTKNIDKDKVKLKNIDTDQDIYNRGLSLFKEEKYTLSETYFNKSIKKSYKHSLSLFYLGEIYFSKKEYKKAFLYYKKCIKSLKNKNNSISYVPEDILYLHIGISLYKFKQLSKANNFFKYVIKSFPESESAREAYLLLKK